MVRRWTRSLAPGPQTGYQWSGAERSESHPLEETHRPGVLDDGPQMPGLMR